ncbi:MAG TPA: outer membrane beta-barrel protein [Paludibacter sp.]|nr:outer membrane beta-barrel protein [Paludibacter sp.]
MKLRKSVCLVLVFLCLSTLMSAQKGQLGITFSAMSDNGVARFRSVEDDSSTDAGKSFTYGISYLKPLNKWLDIETGLEYLSCPIETKSIVGTINGVTTLTRSSTLSMLSIPVTVRANFLKYFFVNGGLLLDVDVSENSIINSQSGLGSILGLGLKYDFKNGISVFVNPYSKIHLFPLTFERNQQHFLESAVRFGIAYKL